MNEEKEPLNNRGKMSNVHFSSPLQRELTKERDPSKVYLWAKSSNIYIIYKGLCSEGPDLCAVLITITSIFMIFLTLPCSLLWCIKVVQVIDFCHKCLFQS